jgi:hypothetical protein
VCFDGVQLTECSSTLVMADLCVAWGAAQPIHLSVSYNLNSTLQWTSSAMETVLNDWTATATENRKHFKRGSELMERSTELLQRTAVQVGWRTTIAAERRAGVAPLELRLLVLTSQKLLPPCRW